MPALPGSMANAVPVAPATRAMAASNAVLVRLMSGGPSSVGFLAISAATWGVARCGEAFAGMAEPMRAPYAADAGRATVRRTRASRAGGGSKY
ncbi:hypothetical protein GCM10010234_72810 [Streptomyces hawaiiensis]